MLAAAGYQVELVDSGCCGMAGAFGYESEHYKLSMAVGELNLLPAVRLAGPDVIVATCGVSCQDQIADGTGRKAIHPITLLRAYLRKEKPPILRFLFS
jgi:Fe-S oxidoreductase